MHTFLLDRQGRHFFNDCSKLTKKIFFLFQNKFHQSIYFTLKLQNSEATHRYLCNEIKLRPLDRETRFGEIFTLFFYIAHSYIANVVFFYYV